MNLDRTHEQSILKLARCWSRGLDGTIGVDPAQEGPRGRRQPKSLPLLARGGHGEKRRPQAPMDIRELPRDQARHEHVVGVDEHTEAVEYLLRPRMTPP